MSVYKLFVVFICIVKFPASSSLKSAVCGHSDLDIDVEMEIIGEGGMTMRVPDSCLTVVKRQIDQARNIFSSFSSNL